MKKKTQTDQLSLMRYTQTDFRIEDNMYKKYNQQNRQKSAKQKPGLSYAVRQAQV